MHVRNLDPDAHIKPLDFGGHDLCGSVDASGRLISVSGYNAAAGLAGFTSARPLSNADRDDRPTVRAYRKELTEIEGFGPRFDEEPTARYARLIADAIPQVELQFTGGRRAVMTVLPCKQGVLQRWQFEGIDPAWGGPVSVQRAVYPLLPVSLDLSDNTDGPTEERPDEDVIPDNHMKLSGSRLQIENNGPDCTVILDGLVCEAPRDLRANDCVALELPPQGTETVILSVAVAEKSADAEQAARALQALRDPATFEQLLEEEAARWEQKLAATPKDPILRRALVYGEICTIPTGPEANCLITDHMILSLSWNRDAWYAAKMFLQAGEAFWPITRGHLIWMFEQADRGEDGFWGRAHFANGAVKDRNFQLDQQIFPLLEFAEYVSQTGDKELFERLRGEIAPVLDAILSRKHEKAWLFPTDETPGDDPLDFKYHFSSHVLLFRALMALHEVLPEAGYAEIADKVRADTIACFTTEYDGSRLFSYASDAEGGHLVYHDANDVPLALAAEWGFVEADDPVWLASIGFAFSNTANKRGCYPNARLGSVHTPAPWPLGDLQKLIVARCLGRKDWEAQALCDLREVAQWDFALPEAYKEEDCNVESRHWFVWPSALYAMLAFTGAA